MKITGKYYHREKIGLWPDCSFLMEKGKIYNINVDLPPIYAFSYPIKDKSEFDFEKLPSEKGLVPIGANYVIEYIGISDSAQKIYLSLSSLQVYKIKYQLKEFLLQDRSLKLGIIKYLVITLIGFLGFLIGRYY